MQLFQPLPLLTAEGEAELARRVHGPDLADALAARNELVLSNLGLVGTAAARSAKRTGADYDDLFSEGVIALVRSAERYDPDTHHTRFSSYAVPSIRNRLKDYVYENRTVSIPAYLQQPTHLAKARACVADRPDLAANLERNVLAANDAILPFASLSSAAPGDSPIDVAAARLSPLEVLIQHETAARITEALGELRPLRAYVIAHRMGLCGVRVRTLMALARELGLSKQRISQIEIAARIDLARVLAPAERHCA